MTSLDYAKSVASWWKRKKERNQLARRVCRLDALRELRAAVKLVEKEDVSGDDREAAAVHVAKALLWLGEMRGHGNAMYDLLDANVLPKGITR